MINVLNSKLPSSELPSSELPSSELPFSSFLSSELPSETQETHLTQDPTIPRTDVLAFQHMNVSDMWFYSDMLINPF